VTDTEGHSRVLHVAPLAASDVPAEWYL